MKTVELQIYKANGTLGLTISKMKDGSGAGYRIFGPKLYGQGVDIKTETLSAVEIDRLILELKAAKKFLKSK